MELAIVVYLIGVLPSVAGFFKFASVALFVIFALMTINSLINADVYGMNSEEGKRSKATIGTLGKKLWIPILLAVVAALIPSEKTMYTMVAAYAGQKIAEIPQAAQIANDGVDVLKELLAKAKRELSEDKKEEKPKEDKK